MRLRPQTSPAIQSQQAEPKPVVNVPQGTTAAKEKPKIDNFQEYGDYVEALADWKIAEARRVDTETWQKAQESNRIAQSWRERVDGAKARYEDFEQVALLSPTSSPQGSLIDAWILEHKAGADVLYSLQKDPAELRRILALPLFEQVDALSLIGQRLSQTRTAAVSTGAAPPTPRPAASAPSCDTSQDQRPDGRQTNRPDPEKASLRDFERYYHRRRD